MLAGGRRLDDPFHMERVRCGDIDCLDRIVGEQRLVAAVGARDAKFLGKLSGAHLVAAGNGGELAGGGFRNGGGKCARDGSGAENSPLNLIGHD